MRTPLVARALGLPLLGLALLSAHCGDDEENGPGGKNGNGGDSNSPPGANTPGTGANTPGTQTPNAPGNPGVPVNYTCKRDIHVSPSGDDSASGLEASAPMKTIANAVKKAEPGDCVKAHEGTYKETKTIQLQKSGTQAEPIVVWSSDGRGKAIIDSSSSSGAVIFMKSDFVIVDGFDFQKKAPGSGEQVIHVAGKGLGSAIRNNKITGGHNHLKINENANGVTVEGNEFYGEFGHIPISLTGSSNMIFRKNTGHDWDVGEDAAIQIKGGSHDSVFDSNRFDNVKTLGGVLALGDGCDSSCDNDPEHYAGVRLKAINNVIVNADRAFNVNGCKDCALLSNTMVDVGGVQFGVVIKMVTATTGGVAKSSTGTRIMNNLFSSKNVEIGQVLDIKPGNGAGLVMDHNLVFSQGNQVEWGNGHPADQDAHSILNQDPLLTADFTLGAGSPAIGKGAKLDDVPHDFTGAARPATHDIGAFQSK